MDNLSLALRTLTFQPNSHNQHTNHHHHLSTHPPTFLSFSLYMDYHHRSGDGGESGPPSYAPRYVMLSAHNAAFEHSSSSGLRPPPNRRNLPRYESRRPSSGCGLCGCFCWCCFFLFLILFIFVAATVCLYIVLDPKPPSYSVNHLGVDKFNLRPEELAVDAEIVATVRAENPNDKVGIWYGKGGSVSVAYQGATICEGPLPAFYQGHRNVTMMRVVMSGRGELGSGLQTALTDSQRSNRIPLDVVVRVPVALRLDEVDLRQVTVNVACSLVVDSLSPGKQVGIKSATYKVNVEL